MNEKNETAMHRDAQQQQRPLKNLARRRADAALRMPLHLEALQYIAARSCSRRSRRPAATASCLRPRSRPADDDHSGKDQQRAPPARAGDLLGEQVLARERSQDVADGRDGQDVAEIGPAHQRHSRQRPEDQQRNTDDTPAIAAFATFKAEAEKQVAGDVADHDNER